MGRLNEETGYRHQPGEWVHRELGWLTAGDDCLFFPTNGTGSCGSGLSAAPSHRAMLLTAIKFQKDLCLLSAASKGSNPPMSYSVQEIGAYSDG